jgi:hypothetical protein
MGHWTDLMNFAADLAALVTAVITLRITSRKRRKLSDDSGDSFPSDPDRR